MTGQMELLREMVTSQSGSTAGRESDPVKLTRLSEDDDIESYLTTFECMMEANEVDKARWASNLHPSSALGPKEAKTYAVVKAAILRCYYINEETYKRFRDLQMKSGETLQELVTHLTDIATKWLRDCTSMEEVHDALIKEQLLETLSKDVHVWMTERKPKTSAEAGQLAEDYLQAWSTMTPTPATTKPDRDRLPPGKCPKCGELGDWASDCQQIQQYWGGQHRPKCFKCNQKGHLSFNCPVRSSLYCEGVELARRAKINEQLSTRVGQRSFYDDLTIFECASLSQEEGGI